MKRWGVSNIIRANNLLLILYAQTAKKVTSHTSVYFNFNLKMKITCKREPCRRNRCRDKHRNGVERAATFSCTARSHREPSSRTWQSGGSEPEDPGTWRISHTASSPSSPPQHRTVQRGYTHHSICAPNTPSPRSAPRISPVPSYTSSISFSSVKQSINKQYYYSLIIINFTQFGNVCKT